MDANFLARLKSSDKSLDLPGNTKPFRGYSETISGVPGIAEQVICDDGIAPEPPRWCVMTTPIISVPITTVQPDAIHSGKRSGIEVLPSHPFGQKCPAGVY